MIVNCFRYIIISRVKTRRFSFRFRPGKMFNERKKKGRDSESFFFSSNEFHTTTTWTSITIRNNNRVPSRYFLLPRFFAKIPKVLALSDTCPCFCCFSTSRCVLLWKLFRNGIFILGDSSFRVFNVLTGIFRKEWLFFDLDLIWNIWKNYN